MSLRVFVRGIAFALGFGILFWSLGPAMVEQEMNQVRSHSPWPVSEDIRRIHQEMRIGDLHADTLLWDRDFRQRSSFGHVDLVRLREGNIAVQVFATVTQSPAGQNYESNTAAFDTITPLVILQGWPKATWFSQRERALYQAERLRKVAQEDPALLQILRTQEDLEVLEERRAQGEGVIGGLLAIEGAHALEGDLGNIQRLRDAGFRMIGLHHFFDNRLGGSLHGESDAGLTDFGRLAVAEIERQGLILDLAHSSEKVVREVLQIAERPLVVSHSGLRSACETPRNIPDSLLVEIAARGGLIGIGFWEGAVCDITPRGVARVLMRAVEVLGEEHVALGSDWDGATTVLFDAAELPVLTQALRDEGLSIPSVRKIMGENLMRFLQNNLPEASSKRVDAVRGGVYHVSEELR